MNDAIPDSITREHIEAALRDLEAGKGKEYGKSTQYDVVVGDRRYPPKAVIGLAAAHATGGRPPHPNDFTGGMKSKCFRVLQQHGYTVSPKPQRKKA